jgi:hypothetical protein
MTQALNIDDWYKHHILAAGAQGWCLSEVALPNTAHYLEIQRLDDAEGVSRDWGVTVPQLADDAAAVDAMREAWASYQEHALLAYHLLKHHSPSEFLYWGMGEWRR